MNTAEQETPTAYIGPKWSQTLQYFNILCNTKDRIVKKLN